MTPNRETQSTRQAYVVTAAGPWALVFLHAPLTEKKYNDEVK